MSLPVKFSGSNCLRQRLVLSTLSGKSLVIEDIRVNGEEPGVTDFEVRLFQLMEKVTNGSSLDVDESGTTLAYKPGLLIGGRIEHDCGLQRSISYFLEVLLCFAPFCKQPLEVTLKGVTNDSMDPTVDSLKHSALPVLKKLMTILDNDEVQLKVIARGMKPNGGGSVFFKCPVRRTLRPVQWLDSGKIKRIRGVAFAARVSPQVANRMVDTSKGLLLQFIPDVYIYTDHSRGKNSGNSPGFGLALMAETTTGVVYTGEAMSNPSGSDKGPSVPEEVAKEATHALFEEIYRGGCADSSSQGLACLFMALGQTDMSKIVLGPLSPYTIQMLRHMKEMLQVTFRLEVDRKGDKDEYKKGSQKVAATCVGIGFSNLSKTVS